ncbi:MAG TPA: DNA-binding protein, partial [Streptococcus parasuis]|nr:DNA-binding protein [Streptococcus parasuis]
SNYLRLNQKNRTSADHFVEELLKNQMEESSKKVISLYPIQVLEEVPLSAGYGESYYDEYRFSTVYSDEEYS